MSETEGQSCLDTIKPVLYFETVKFVTVESIRFGIAHRLMQFLVLIFVAVVLIWYQQGYQDFCNVSGTLYVKVKGVGTFGSNATGVQVYDSVDYVRPPIESNALFITTGLLITPQQNGACDNLVSPCVSDADCPNNTLSADGLTIPQCNLTTGRCLLRGWCPMENPNATIAKLDGLDEATVFLRSSASYPLFDMEAYDPIDPIPGRNLFRLGDIIKTQQCGKGCMVQVTIDWTCNLDNGVENCVPQTTFTPLSGTFNYRLAQYYSTIPGREVRKLYGMRLLVSITGRGGKFNFFRLGVTLGSSVAFFTVTTLITDYILFFIYRRSDLYLGKKYSHFDLDKQKEKQLIEK